MIKDVDPLLKECEETLAELKKIGNMEVACYVQGFINSINKLPDAEQRPHVECGTCKHFVKGGLDGKTYVCEHPSIEQDDYYNYACLAMEENDFCSCYEPRKKVEKSDFGTSA